ncbi:MAG: acetylglutamate kinase [Armatimonadota bacterium]|nr:MAG: acetylglutamate kinase [Armatimonadota bacterium]
MQEAIHQANVLVQALPYMQRYAGKCFVIKYGGAAMVDERLKAQVMQDIVLLRTVGIKPVLVHGGGKEVSEVMQRMGLQPRFAGGLRVTDAETMEIVEMVLAGTTNKGIVSLIHRAGGKAVGLSGKDGNLLVAKKLTPEGKDIGYVGEVTQVNAEVIEVLSEAGYIPVISSVAIGEDGQSYNVNADHAAGAIAAALQAEKLIVLTDVPGVLANLKDPASLISEMSIAEAEELLRNGKAESGMAPKLEACITALRGGVQRAHIIDGRQPHAILIEVFTDRGVGTMVKP